MLEALLKRMDEWRRLGYKESSDGSRIIAHIPRDFPQAYLHQFFAPRCKAEWDAYGFKLPVQLRHLYAECNGLSLFGGALVIYGIRSHYRRDESAQFQPFDLITHAQEHEGNLRHLPVAGCSARVFFGSFEDGSGIYVESDSPEVGRVIGREAKPVNQWPDIKTLLESEYERISRLFTPEGYLRQKGMATTPEPESGK